MLHVYPPTLTLNARCLQGAEKHLAASLLPHLLVYFWVFSSSFSRSVIFRRLMPRVDPLCSNAEVLPEDKAAFIRQEKAKGHTVIMVGDGVNDSPALSEADAGIAISTGAAIAREIADITVASEDLFALVTLRKISQALMERIHGSYRFIVGFNLTLIALGVAGVLPPTTSALLHNGSTLGISLRNMTDLLNDEENTQK